ncbi:MAG: LPS assembly lipoprotein LptE [Burkholderiales bacterium]
MRALIIPALLISLAACGFHLRGEGKLPFSTLFVSGPAAGNLVNELRQTLIRRGVRLVEKQEDAEVGLILLSDTQEKSILSLSGAGRAQEYELRKRISFRIVDTKNPDLPAAEIVSQRVISYNDAQVLAKESEEALLYRDMEKDAIQQLLRRIAVIKK